MNFQVKSIQPSFSCSFQTDFERSEAFVIKLQFSDSQGETVNRRSALVDLRAVSHRGDFEVIHKVPNVCLFVLTPN